MDADLAALLTLLAALAAGWAAHWLLLRILRRVVREAFGRRLLDRVVWPSRLAVLMLAVWLVSPSMAGAAFLGLWVGRVMGVCVVVLLGWIAIVAINAYFDLASRRLDISVADNLAARKRLTQIRLLRRTTTVLVGFLTASAAVMTLPGVRELGLSLFASAGVAGIVVGFAAQPVLANLIAGMQIAITQPIRLDDAVVVEGEWGWIEDIRGTYVVVRVWDLRRLVVPIAYFIQTPFQNWTRESASLIGTVFWYVDYSVPVEAVRAKLEALVRASARWDGRVAVLQVTDVKPDTVELRGLMSAANSSLAWDLRCEIREKLLAWLGETYQGALPRQRLAFAAEAPEPTPPAHPPPAPSGDAALAAAAPAGTPEHRGAPRA